MATEMHEEREAYFINAEGLKISCRYWPPNSVGDQLPRYTLCLDFFGSLSTAGVSAVGFEL
jgi:hypothetical protein